MSVLRFFFADRFNRFDAAVIVIVTALQVTGQLGILASVATLLVGFMLSGIGALALRRALASEPQQ